MTFATKPAVFTIGHSTRAASELIALLDEVRTDALVDVRSVPRSRTNPQFNIDALPSALATAGIAYHHVRELGGLRHRRKDAAPSPNTLWQNESFRNYADYAATEAFRAGLSRLLTLAQDHVCTLMCAEAVWWRCHRRIIADYLIASGVPVFHIMGHDRREEAALTRGARVGTDGTLVYPSESAADP
jgi:uncharacterized protein (DUF488 family)